jgi:cation transport ATPase
MCQSAQQLSSTVAAQNSEAAKAIAFVAATRTDRTSDPHACVLVMLCFEDRLQAGSADAVSQLLTGSWRSGGKWGDATAAKSVTMLTGDNEYVAAAVARAAGISTFAAGLRPEHKRERVMALRGGSVSHGKAAAWRELLGNGQTTGGIIPACFMCALAV